jgi:hypothetical protein
MAADLAAVHERLTEAVRLSFADAESRPGEEGLRMSLSKLGGCTREGAYRISGTPPDLGWEQRQKEKRPAALGTWEHRGIIPRLRRRLRGARSEMPVVLSGSGLTLAGRADLRWRRAAKHGGAGIVDVKTVREYGLTWVRENGARDRDQLQVDAYAMACREAGEDIRWTAIIYLDRAGGDDHIVVQPFDPSRAWKVMDRLAELASAAKMPAMASRDERGPGLSWVCDGCAWLKQCWGEGAEPGQVGGQNILIQEGAYQVEAVLEMYDAARARVKEGTEDKEFARALLVGQPAGDYGAFTLGWGRSSRGGSIDKAKAWDALAGSLDLESLAADKGVDLPRRGPRQGNISVGPVDA